MSFRHRIGPGWSWQSDIWRNRSFWRCDTQMHCCCSMTYFFWKKWSNLCFYIFLCFTIVKQPKCRLWVVCRRIALQLSCASPDLLIFPGKHDYSACCHAEKKQVNKILNKKGSPDCFTFQSTMGDNTKLCFFVENFLRRSPGPPYNVGWRFAWGSESPGGIAFFSSTLYGGPGDHKKIHVFDKKSWCHRKKVGQKKVFSDPFFHVFLLWFVRYDDTMFVSMAHVRFLSFLTAKS